MSTQRTRDVGSDQRPGSPDAGWEHRLETLEARMEHLTKQLEALQDALYRQSGLEHENIAQLRRRIEPKRMARDLDQDARNRGL
jgi:uncharacterized coiled-coil protein SlyX